jgi:hypothetical protein
MADSSLTGGTPPPSNGQSPTAPGQSTPGQQVQQLTAGDNQAINQFSQALDSASMPTEQKTLIKGQLDTLQNLFINGGPSGQQVLSSLQETLAPMTQSLMTATGTATPSTTLGTNITQQLGLAIDTLTQAITSTPEGQRFMTAINKTHQNLTPGSGSPTSTTGTPAPAAGNPPPATGTPPPAAGNPPPATGTPPPATGNPPPMTGNPPPMTGNPPPAAGNTAPTLGSPTSTIANAIPVPGNLVSGQPSTSPNPPTAAIAASKQVSNPSAPEPIKTNLAAPQEAQLTPPVLPVEKLNPTAKFSSQHNPKSTLLRQSEVKSQAAAQQSGSTADLSTSPEGAQQQGFDPSGGNSSSQLGGSTATSGTQATQGPNQSSRVDQVKQVVTQMVSHIQTMVSKDMSSVTLTLSAPPELQGVQVEISTHSSSNKQLDINFANLTPDQQNILQENMKNNPASQKQLSDALQQHGFTVNKLEVSNPTQTNESQGQGQDQEEGKGEQGQGQDEQGGNSNPNQSNNPEDDDTTS